MVFIECKTLDEAEARAPWAEHLEKVEGGYMAFERWSKFEEWKNQV